MEASKPSQAMEVCSNPLCRRKWKLLSAAALPFVCPSCRKWLDLALAKSVADDGQRCSVDQLHERADYPRLVLRLWACVYAEIADLVRVPRLRRKPEDIPALSSFAGLHSAYLETFPFPPDAASVRNWSSMGQRKKPTVGRVSRKFQFVCELNAAAGDVSEVGGNFFIDWLGEFSVHDQVKFLTFPNPSVCERDVLPVLVKPLTSDSLSSQTLSHLPSDALVSDRSTGGSNSLDSILLEWAKSSSPELPVATSAPMIFTGRRPDWIPDTPATPLYLQQQQHFSASSAPPSALLDLLRAAAASSPNI